MKLRAYSLIPCRRRATIRIIRSTKGVSLRLACRRRATSSWLHTDGMTTLFESLPLASQRGQKGSSMRKAKKLAADELRSEYKRSDFGPLVAGKINGATEKVSHRRRLGPGVARLFPKGGGGNPRFPPPGGDPKASR